MFQNYHQNKTRASANRAIQEKDYRNSIEGKLVSAFGNRGDFPRRGILPTPSQCKMLSKESTGKAQCCQSSVVLSTVRRGHVCEGENRKYIWRGKVGSL